MKKLLIITLIFTFISANKSEAQSDFNPKLLIKTIDNTHAKLRIIPRDYFEFKAIGTSGIEIKILPIGARNNPLSLNQKYPARTLILDTASIAEWQNKGVTPYEAAVAQLLYAKPQLYGSTFTEQVSNAKKIQDNTFIMAILGSSFSWDAAVNSRTGADLKLHTDSLYQIEVKLLRPSPYSLSNSKIANVLYNGPQKIEFNYSDFEAIGLEKGVRLYWSENEQFIAYHVETANTNETDIQRLTNSPYFNQTKDSVNSDWLFDIKLNDNYVPKKYRIAGFDVFGDSTHYSPWIIGFGKDRTPPSPVTNVQLNSQNPQHVQLTWDISEDKDRHNIEIYYSNNSEKPDIKLGQFPPNLKQFSHNEASNIKPNYYWIFTTDTAGNSSAPFPYNMVTFDTIQPITPTIISAVMDSTGLIKLNWKSNPEEDINGYKIGVGRTSNSKPINLSETIQIDTFFTEKISPKQISGNLFYSVKSIDLKGNHSNWSDPIKIEIPDKIPPSFAVISSITPTEDGSIRIDIILPNDQDATNLAYRKIINSTDTTIWTTQPLNGQIIDVDVSPNKTYQYQIKVVDKALNESKTTISGTISPFPRKINTDNIKLIAEINKDRKINVSWDGLPGNIKMIKFYKQSGVEPFYEIAKFGPDRKSLVTEKMPAYTVHKFAIKLIDNEGNYSDLIESNTVYIAEKIK